MTEEKKLWRDRAWLNEQYWENSLHFNEIAELAGCSPTTIPYWLQKLGIPFKKAGTFAIYPTPDELEGLLLPNQDYGTLGEWGLPELFIIYDDLEKVRHFLLQFHSKSRSRLRRVTLINQIGDTATVTRHWKHTFRTGTENKHDLTVQVYDLKPQVDYYAYINSDEWRDKSMRLKNAVGKCQLCGWKESLRAHHNTYATLGNEGPYDLFVICAGCHELFHKERNLVSPEAKRI